MTTNLSFLYFWKCIKVKHTKVFVSAASAWFTLYLELPSIGMVYFTPWAWQISASLTHQISKSPSALMAKGWLNKINNCQFVHTTKICPLYCQSFDMAFKPTIHCAMSSRTLKPTWFVWIVWTIQSCILPGTNPTVLSTWAKEEWKWPKDIWWSSYFLHLWSKFWAQPVAFVVKVETVKHGNCCHSLESSHFAFKIPIWIPPQSRGGSGYGGVKHSHRDYYHQMVELWLFISNHSWAEMK